MLRMILRHAMLVRILKCWCVEEYLCGLRVEKRLRACCLGKDSWGLLAVLGVLRGCHFGRFRDCCV